MTEAVEKPLENAPDEHFDSEPRELLVATPHAELVLASLRELNLPAPTREDSRLLGLTRLTFQEELSTKGLIEERATAYLPRLRIGTPRDNDPIGTLLSAVKETIMHDWGGWIPTMGRNRILGHVTGTDGGPIISGGDPELVADSDGLSRGKFAELDLFVEQGAVGALPGDGVRVGIVDTTLHPHSWLQGSRVQPQPAPLESGSAWNIRASHAVAMVGIVLQKAPGAEIDVIGVLGEEGWTTSWDAANAIASFGSTDIDILNLSFACYTDNGDPPLALSTAIDRLHPRTVVVAAAGNFRGHSHPTTAIDLSKAPAWPAALDDVVAVGAIETSTAAGPWRTADFSPETPWVDVVALGNEVLSLLAGAPGGVHQGFTGATSVLPDRPRFAKWNGTSPATALVTGAIAARMTQDQVSAKVALNRLYASAPALGSGPYHPKVFL